MKQNKHLEYPIYFGAKPDTLRKASELRKNMTKAEELLWEKLSKKQLQGYKFRRQHPISQFIADFYCHVCKLVIEVDGGYHYNSEQRDYDKGRSEELECFGIKVIRFSNNEIENNIDEVLEQIILYLK